MFDALTLDHVRNKGEPKNKGPKAEIGVDSWGGAAAPPHQLGGSGERCKFPSGVRGGAPTTQRFSTIFSTQDGVF